jgi:hypothetical protein
MANSRRSGRGCSASRGLFLQLLEMGLIPSHLDFDIAEAHFSLSVLVQTILLDDLNLFAPIESLMAHSKRAWGFYYYQK